MKIKLASSANAAVLLLALSTLNPQPSTFAQGTTFTYQGRLTDNGSPATGYYDILFSLYDAPTMGTQLDGTLMGTAVPVTNGLFTVSLDFGSGIFTGPGRWLKLDVRTNGLGPYNPLSPRQALTASPYAVTAGNMTGNLPASQVSGTLAVAQLPAAVVTNNQGGVSLSGTFTGNGASVSNVNALTLGGLGAGSFWKTAGNAGTTAGANFVGTTDNQPLELRVNNQRALRLESKTNSYAPNGGAPNVIGGSSGNLVGTGVVGATIAGGGATDYDGYSYPNTVLADFGAIGGGDQNYIGAGSDNAIIAGGWMNAISGAWSAIGGGDENSLIGVWSTLAGGFANYVTGDNSTIGGGNENVIGSVGATIAGGDHNWVLSDSGAIGGGSGNRIFPGTYGSSIAGGVGNLIGNEYSSGAFFGNTIGGGAGNHIAAKSDHATIAGGKQNAIGTNSPSSTVAGGEQNTIAANSDHATIAGGFQNSIGTNSSYSVIGGGYTNTIVNSYAASIVGGNENIIESAGANLIGTGQYNWIYDRPVWSAILSGYYNQIGGGYYCFIGSGFDNDIYGGDGNAIVAGTGNLIISGGSQTIAGGDDNLIEASSVCNIQGGYGNRIQWTSGSTIGGGGGNSISTNAAFSVIGGGRVNSIGTNSPHAAIGGGLSNNIPANAAYATIPGGQLNTATNNAFAAGTQAKAVHTGALVWGDSTPAGIASTNANSVTFRASGGYRLFSDTSATAGVFLAPGGTSWASISDRDAKKDFAPVDSRTLLEKLASMPITQWHYKWEDQNVTPHMGPMAQDFKAAFYPGSDDKSITTQEADGVALAAIQGLNEKLEVRSQKSEVSIQNLQAENAELRQRMERLERLLNREQGGVR